MPYLPSVSRLDIGTLFGPCTAMYLSMSQERLLYEPSPAVSVRIVLDGLAIMQDHAALLYNNEPDFDKLIFSYCRPYGGKTDKIPQKIRFVDVLWCEHEPEAASNCFNLTFVHQHTIVRMQVHVDIADFTDHDNDISSYILSHAYTNGLIKPSIYVLLNPHGGTGLARSIYDKHIEKVLKAANADITFVETTYLGHATDLMRELDVSKYDIIVCCSGDGIPFEVINGFYSRPDKGVSAFNKLAVTQLPCGSGNALSLSTHGTDNAFDATVAMLKSQRTKLDLMAVTQGTGENATTRLSFLSQCYGMIADADIGTEHLRWIGSIRFELGVLQKVLLRATYPCELWIDYATDTKQQLREHYDDHLGVVAPISEILSLALNLKYPGLDSPPPTEWVKVDDQVASTLNQVYVGNLPYVSKGAQFFPAALPNDHLMDLIMTTSKSSIIDTFSAILAVEKGTHVHNSKVFHAKIRGYRLIPKINSKGHYISVDGESFPFEPYQVEVFPGILTGLLTDSKFVATSYTS